MYDFLFSEMEIGGYTVKNRIVFCGPITGYARGKHLTTQLAAYYLERAKGGAGLIELEPALAFRKQCLSEWREFVERIHAYGTKLVASLKIRHKRTDAAEKDAEKELAESSEFIRRAGLDGISLLLENKKVEGNWLRSHLQKITAGRKGNFLLGVHLTTPDAESGKAAAEFLQDAGVNYLVLPKHNGYDEFDTSVPVVKSVGFPDPDSCEKWLRNGGGDMVALAGQLVCDPYWPVKAELSREKEIRMHDCCENESETMAAGRISCMLNPYLGQESRYSENNMTPAAKFKNVVIVGGGPAGMQAAITASKRGHRIFLFEKEKELGGRIKAQGCPEAVDWLVGEMKRNQVDVRLGVPVTAEHVAVLKPDIVIMAVSGSPARKPIISSLHEKGIQVIDINDCDCSIGQSIRNGFNVAIGI